MSHLSTLELTMLADGVPADHINTELSTHLSKHLESCPECTRKLARIAAESRLIAHSLQTDMDPLGQAGAVAIPKFKRPLTFRSFALANLGTGLVIWLAQFLWKTIFGELVMNATAWATSIFLPDVYSMASTTFLYLMEEGTAMFDAYLGLIIFTLSVAALGWGAWHFSKQWRHNTSAMASLLIAGVGLSVLAADLHALEIRRDSEIITVEENETIDDTVLFAGDTILIAGHITGDVFAAGRRIEVSGSVDGNLITFAEFVTVDGTVGGVAIGGANTYDVRAARIKGDLWAAGEKVTLDADAEFARNVTAAGETVKMDGSVAKDFSAFAESVELRGTVGQDLEAFANRVRLLGTAAIEGDANIRSDNPDVLHQEPGVTVGGEVTLSDAPKELQRRSRYASLEYYMWQLVWLASAFIVGLGLLWLVPGLRTLSLGAGLESAKTVGVGFLTLISVPIAALIIAITLVGLPVALMAFGGWLVALYLAKIMLGIVIGGMIMDRVDWRSLLLGLAIVLVATNLPFIGGVVSFVLTLLGLGLLVRYLIDSFSERPTTAAL